MRVTSKDTMPTDEPSRYERGLDPWHADAFPAEFKASAPRHGERKEGWFVMDAWRNQIGFIPDGTVIEEKR